jgi:hypothetical protein
MSLPKVLVAAVSVAATLVSISGDTAADSLSSVRGKFPSNETVIGGVAFVASGTTACPTDATKLNITQQVSITNQGLWTFDGKGHIQVDDTGVEVTVTQSQSTVIAAQQWKAHCEGTYNIESDGSLAIDNICSIPGMLQIDLHSRGILTPHIILQAAPPALTVSPVYSVSATGTRSLVACALIGANGTIVRDGVSK